jgi:hypothetical protein
MQACIGDAGLIVENDGAGTLVLRCGDGYDAVNFKDLVVTPSLLPACAATPA